MSRLKSSKMKQSSIISSLQNSTNLPYGQGFDRLSDEHLAFRIDTLEKGTFLVIYSTDKEIFYFYYSLFFDVN